MTYRLQDIATAREIEDFCKEDHSPFKYTRDEGGFAISMSGHYTAGELTWAARALAEANQFYTPLSSWLLRLQWVQCWKAFKQDPSPRLQTAINQLYKAMRSQA